MYKHVYPYIRLTDKFFDTKLIDKLKIEIKNNEYFTYWKDISELNTMSELFALFGIRITNIQDDEYHWATINANFVDIKIVEKLLRRYHGCFYEYSRLAFRQPGCYNYFLFSHGSKCFVEERLDYIVEEDFGERFKIINKNGEFQRNKVNTNEFIVTSALEIYEEFCSAWSEDSNSYSLRKENGLWRCRYDVPIYDGVCITLFGYGHSKYEALEHCEKEYNKLKELAIEEGFSEED